MVKPKPTIDSWPNLVPLPIVDPIPMVDPIPLLDPVPMVDGPQTHGGIAFVVGLYIEPFPLAIRNSSELIGAMCRCEHPVCVDKNCAAEDGQSPQEWDVVGQRRLPGGLSDVDVDAVHDLGGTILDEAGIVVVQSRPRGELCCLATWGAHCMV